MFRKPRSEGMVFPTLASSVPGNVLSHRIFSWYHSLAASVMMSRVTSTRPLLCYHLKLVIPIHLLHVGS